MSLAEIREGLAERLRTIDGLEDSVSAYIIEPPSFPYACIDIASTSFETSFGGVSGDKTHMLQVTLFVGRSQASAEQQAQLDEFVDNGGVTSVIAAILDDDTLGLDYAKAIVHETAGYGVAAIGNQTYSGVTFDVEVNESAS